MSLSVAEARIRRLMARLSAAEQRARVVENQILRTRQDLANFRSVGAGNNARVSGVIEGCAEVGFPGATVEVYRQGTSSLMGRFTADADGLYGGLLCLATDPQDVDIVATPVGTYAARFDEILAPVSLAFGDNPIGPIVIPPTEDWCCGETDYFPGDCTCVNTGTHNCVCGCLDPYARAATIGDDEGTHNIVAPGFGAAWTSSGLVAATQTYGPTGPNSLCTPADMTWEYTYTMIFLCGTNQWRLRLAFGLASCRDVVGGPIVDRPGTATSTFVQAFATLDCDNNDMITFTLPTTTSGGLAVPGGGGVVTVVFS